MVPAGVDFEVDFLASGFSLAHNAFQGGRIGDDRLVVVQEVAVVRGHRVGVHQFAQGDRGNGTAVVLGLDDLSVLGGQLNQGAGGDQAGQLVLGKAEDVRAAFDVGNHVGGGIAFANRLNHNGHAGELGVGGLEFFGLGAGQLDHGVRDPDFDFAIEAFGAGDAIQRQQKHQGQDKRKRFFHEESSLFSWGFQTAHFC